MFYNYFMSNLDKLKYFEKTTKETSANNDIISKIYKVTIYSGFCDFQAIQLARVLEQIIIKNQIHKKLPFDLPHEDSFFYDKKISTRKIFIVIEKQILPNIENHDDKKIIKEYLNFGHSFLDKRNVVIHDIGNPKKDLDKVLYSIDKALELYEEMTQAHSKLMEYLAPYTLSEKELLIIKNRTS